MLRALFGTATEGTISSHVDEEGNAIATWQAKVPEHPKGNWRADSF